MGDTPDILLLGKCSVFEMVFVCVCVCVRAIDLDNCHSPLNLWLRQNPTEIKTKERDGTLEKYTFCNLTIFYFIYI